MSEEYFPQPSLSAYKFTKAHKVIISNPYQGVRQVTFKKELVMVDDEDVMTKPVGSISEVFNAENANEVFQVVDPLTGQDTGKTLTYQEAEAMVFSLFFHLERKAAAAPDVPLI